MPRKTKPGQISKHSGSGAISAVNRVFVRHGSYHYDLGRDENGKRRSTVLCRLSDGEHKMYEALGRLISPKATTVGDLLTTYLAKGMAELAPRTRLDYAGYCKAGRPLRVTFDDTAAEEVQPTHIAQYLELRKEQGAKVLANKEVACLASAFEYGQRVGLSNGNPCRQVRRNRCKPKDRYVRNAEFLTLFEAAPVHLQDLMAGIYLMELRTDEARRMRRHECITPQGVRFEEGKTGKIKIISWSPALQFFLTRAASRCPSSPWVFTNSRGEKWTVSAMDSAMDRLRERVPGVAHFTWHDIRAKGESDHQDGGMGLLPLYRRAQRHRPVA